MEENLKIKTETSISGFLKHVLTEQDFIKKEETSIYELGKSLIDFNVLLTAPQYVPSDEPVSLFRVHDGLEIEEEEEEKEIKGDLFKDTLRNVLKKYTQKTKEKIEENEEGEMKKEKETIPDIGK